MATTAPTAAMTAEEFFDWCGRPENAGKRLELDNGRVVEMPSPGRRHGTVCGLTTRLLGNYTFTRGGGSVATNDSGLIVRRNPDTVRGPDIMLFLTAATFDDIPAGPADETPALVVEVLSPSDNMTRTLRRVRQYHGRGVPLVWLIDPEERTVHVYRPDEFPKVLEFRRNSRGGGWS
jgi:Uma2 family endonuclease